MARTWEPDDPKAGVMTRKRAQIVEAARAAFLSGGYAASSVNKIAADAGVSIKTLYRHFETKDDLFRAVMEAACAPDSSGPPEPGWYSCPPATGLARAGAEYLRHALSPDQLAIYRVVAQDASRFPEIGRIYRREVLGRGGLIFGEYLDRWQQSSGWTINNKYRAAAVFGGLLKAGVFEQTLLGEKPPSAEQIALHAQGAAGQLMALLEAGRL